MSETLKARKLDIELVTPRNGVDFEVVYGDVLQDNVVKEDNVASAICSVGACCDHIAGDYHDEDAFADEESGDNSGENTKETADVIGSATRDESIEAEEADGENRGSDDTAEERSEKSAGERTGKSAFDEGHKETKKLVEIQLAILLLLLLLLLELVTVLRMRIRT